MITLRCPTCNRKQRSADLMECATIVVRRTCPKCKTRWQIKIVPLKKTEKAHIHKAEWLKLEK